MQRSYVANSYFNSTEKTEQVDPFQERWDLLRTIVLDKLNQFIQNPNTRSKGKCFDLRYDVQFIDTGSKLSAYEKISALHYSLNPNFASPEFTLNNSAKSKTSSKIKHHISKLFSSSDDFESTLQDIRNVVVREIVGINKVKPQNQDRFVTPM